jgi:hypothetical protein
LAESLRIFQEQWTRGLDYILYFSFLFIQLFEINDLLNWWIQFLSTVFLKYTFITIGIVLFYGIGELWRKKLQFKNVTDNQKLAIISGMTLGGLMIIYQGQSLFMPVKLTAYEVK